MLNMNVSFFYIYMFFVYGFKTLLIIYSPNFQGGHGGSVEGPLPGMAVSSSTTQHVCVIRVSFNLHCTPSKQ